MVLYERSAQDIEQGLVGFWKLDDVKSGATTAIDRAKFNDGTESESLSSATDFRGRANQAVVFAGEDADSQYYDLGNIPEVSFGTSDFTMACWVYPTAQGNQMSILSKYTSGGGNREYYWYIEFNREMKFWHSDDGSGTSFQILNSGFTLTLNRWTHLAMTKQGTDVKFYADGVLVSSPTSDFASIFEGTSTARISTLAVSATTPDHGWNGRMNNLRVYKRVLTGGEISKLFRLRK